MTQVRVAHATDETSVRELLFLQRLSKAAASTIEPDALLDLIINETTGAMQVEVCSLYLYDPDGDEVILTATNGLDAGTVGKAKLKVGSGVTGWVAQHLQALVVPDVTQEPRFQWLRGVDQKRLVAMLSGPILAGPRRVGGVKSTSGGAGAGAILGAIQTPRSAPVELFNAAGFRLERPGPRGGARAPIGLGLSRLDIPTSITGSASTEAIEVTAGRPARQIDLTPIRAGDELLAVLAAEAVEDRKPNQRRAPAPGAAGRALELAKERAAAEVERRLRGDLVEELLGHGLEREETTRLAAQAERLGHRLSNRSWVLVVEPDDEIGSGALESLAMQDRLHRLVSDLCARRFPGSLVVTRSASLVLILPLAGPETDAPTGSELRNLETFGELILQTLHRVVRGGSFSLGIGNATGEVHELPRAHDEARQSLRLARRGGATRRVASYRNLGAFRLLLEVQNPVALARFVDETLGPLVRYQEGRRTPLVDTLEQLSAQHWNRRAAARALHLHVNSLAYRVQRIEALLGLSLEDAETRVALSIALRARSLLPS